MIRFVEPWGPLRKETVWFAHGPYSSELYPAPVTYFRQHDLDIPDHLVARGDVFPTLHIDLRDDPDRIFGRFAKTVRYEIRRAEKEGIDVDRIDTDRDLIAAFCARQAAFHQRKGLGPSLTLPQLELMRPHWVLFSASLGRAWLADLLLVRDDQRARYWAALSDLDFLPRSVVGYASKLLVWRAICDARAHRCDIFDFGGIVLDSTDFRFGVTRYKRAFGGIEVVERNALVITSPLLRAGYRARSPLRRLSALFAEEKAKALRPAIPWPMRARTGGAGLDHPGGAGVGTQRCE